MSPRVRPIAIAVMAALVFATEARAQSRPDTVPMPSPQRPYGPQRPQHPQRPTRGVTLHTPGAAPGYTLIAPQSSTTIHLVDLDGREVHRWETEYRSGTEVFLENGDLLRCCVEPCETRFEAGGACGRLQELDWDGRVVWSFAFADDEHVQHHDLKALPDGHVLLIAWEHKTRDEAREAGRRPDCIPIDGLWSDCIFEIEPLPPDGARIVWEWHAFDHLIQDLDRDCENHGDVAAHPERIDVNVDVERAAPTTEETAKLQALGYAERAVTPSHPRADWLHLNAIDWNPALDQIVISSRHLDEIWIIDHSTTTEEARGRVGGRSGHGGDLLWRWGNPKNYRGGDGGDQRLFGQHDVRFIPEGLPGAGHLTLFNNGWRRPRRASSEVIELELPWRDDGDGPQGSWFESGGACGPAAPIWHFEGSEQRRFYAPIESGAQRLANGDTLVCDGPRGHVFEVDPAGTPVWDYLNPFGDLHESHTGPAFALFRATRIAPDHPGLQRRDLSPQRQ